MTPLKSFYGNIDKLNNITGTRKNARHNNTMPNIHLTHEHIKSNQMPDEFSIFFYYSINNVKKTRGINTDNYMTHLYNIYLNLLFIGRHSNAFSIAGRNRD